MLLFHSQPPTTRTNNNIKNEDKNHKTIRTRTMHLRNQDERVVTSLQTSDHNINKKMTSSCPLLSSSPVVVVLDDHDDNNNNKQKRTVHDSSVVDEESSELSVPCTTTLSVSSAETESSSSSSSKATTAPDEQQPQPLSSSLSSSSQSSSIRILSASKPDIVTGKVLGSGSNFSVLEVDGFSPFVIRLDNKKNNMESQERSAAMTTSTSSTTESTDSDRTTTAKVHPTWMKQRQTTSSSEQPQTPNYVVKVLRSNKDSKIRKLKSLRQNIIELKKEGEILARLSHRNDVLRIHAWSFDNNNDDDNNNSESLSLSTTNLIKKPEDHFLFLERLDETLLDKLSMWKAHRGYYCSLKKQIISKRCQIIIELAEALKHIHSCGIIHRDLKPGNIGLLNGHVKVFDFGVSKVLPPKNRSTDDENQTYNLTGMVGTIRYMAPEVGRKEQYNHKSDVYSFSLICHEILTLERPYMNIIPGGRNFKNSRKRAMEYVWCRPEEGGGGGERPSFTDGWVRWPKPLSAILQRCWDDDITNRPTMDEAQDLLTKALPLLWRNEFSRRVKRILRKVTNKNTK